MSLSGRADDLARQPLRGRYHCGVWRGTADLELHPDACLRRRSGRVRHGRAERRRGKWHRVNRIATVGVAFSIAVTGSVILVLELFGAPAFSPFLPAGSPALAIAAHLNHIATPSYHVLRDRPWCCSRPCAPTGAVMLPLAIMTMSLLLVRFPLADAFIPLSGGCHLVELPDLLRAGRIPAVLYYKFGGWRAARMVPAGYLGDERRDGARGATCNA